MNQLFSLDKKGTSVQTEVLSGLITFFSISYILFVHPMMLAEAGVPITLSLLATIFISIIASLSMGFYANSPLVMSPGLGMTAYFAYTLVGSLGFSWQQALAIVIISSLIFVALTFTGVIEQFSLAIPLEIKKSITIGIGLFLLKIGLQNTGFLVNNQFNWTWIGFFGLLIVFILTRLNIKGNFLIAIALITVVFWVFTDGKDVSSTSALSQVGDYVGLIDIDFSNLINIEGITAVFSLVMLLIFQALGIVEAFITDREEAKKSYQVVSIMSVLSGVLGTSPAITVSENAAGNKEGARSGLSTVVAGLAFVLALFATPLFGYIPSVAVGPVIVFTGISMGKLVKTIEVPHWSLWIPAITIMISIPLTGSIVSGMAYGFIVFPVVALLFGHKDRINNTIYIISGLFLILLIIEALM